MNVTWTPSMLHDMEQSAELFRVRYQPLLRLPALVPFSALPDLWINDFHDCGFPICAVVIEEIKHGWAMVTAKTGKIGSRPWFALDRAELARVLFPVPWRAEK